MKRIQDIFATRRLKTIFDFTGAFQPQLDETIVPVVVLETFNISDRRRGPIECVAAGETVISGAGLPPWVALLPALQAQIPPIRPYLPVYRIKSIQVSSDTDDQFIWKVTPTIPPIVGLQDGIAIWEDRRYASTLPDAFVRESNAVDGVLPAGGINVWRTMYQAASRLVKRWDPVNFFIQPGQVLVGFSTRNAAILRYQIEWQELDPDQTGPSNI